MERNVTVIVMARIKSSRCPQKIFKPFADNMSLFELMCRRLHQLNVPYAAGIGDPELVEIAQKYNVPVFVRSEEEVNASTPLSKVFKCVEQCQTSHAMIISPCTPFIQMETINQACRDFCSSEGREAMSSVIKEQNWFFDAQKKPLIPIDVYNMVSNDLCVYALANVFELFPVKRFMEDNIYYTFTETNDPYLYEIPKKEAFDIDDQEDFDLAQYMWTHQKNG